MKKFANQHILPIHLLICSFAHFLILFPSCGLDTDDAYYPVTDQQFLLIGDTDRQLLHIQQDEVREDWLSQQGWSAQVSDMDQAEGVFWFASGQSQELLRWDGSTGESQHFSTAPFQPHAIVVGNSYLMLIDSVNNKLGFWDPESATLLLNMPWEAEIGEALHVGEKFFIQKGKRRIEVMLESNLQSVAEISFDQDILSLQLNPSFFLNVFTADSMVYQQIINYYSYTPDFSAIPLHNLDRLEITPYHRSLYGKEWLSNIWKQNQNLLNRRPNYLIVKEVSSYAIDFFEGQILYQRNDSLHRHDIREGSSQYMGPLALPIRKYRALQRPIGQ